VSYYTLPSTVMHHPVHKALKAAYSFYNVSKGTPWIDLMGDALVSAKNVSLSAGRSFLLVTWAAWKWQREASKFINLANASEHISFVFKPDVASWGQ
jgi:hypothetical protein